MCIQRSADSRPCKGRNLCGQKETPGSICAYEHAIEIKRARAAASVRAAQTHPDPSFVQQYLAGRVTADAVDDFVDLWHSLSGPGTPALEQFLGFTSEQYAQWLRDPSRLDDILRAA